MVDDFQNEDGHGTKKIGRRGFLIKSSLALATGSAGIWVVLHRDRIASAWESIARHTAENGSEANPQKTSSIPDLASVREYRSYLSKVNLPYLSPDEIIRPQFKYRSGVCSGVPPKHLWKNIRDTARVANEVRRRLGVPLHTVISSYRSPEYNDRCPGASKYSQHLKNRALDLVYACPPKEAFDMAVKIRKEGYFKGGIGLYQSFIHIDTRGRNATWS